MNLSKFSHDNSMKVSTATFIRIALILGILSLSIGCTSGTTPSSSIVFPGAAILSMSSSPVSTVLANGNPAASLPKPADLVFFDNFEYVVSRDDVNAVSLFQKKGGWSWAKTRQTGGHGPGYRGNGYLYTVASIPGSNSSFPGNGSGRVLAMEALPGSLGGQTDFYLQYGGETSKYDNTIPGDVWFQFWIYINHAANQRSQIDGRNKFIYPCNTAYPCRGNKWLLSLGSYSYLPKEVSLGSPSTKGAFLQNGAAMEGVAELTNNNYAPWDRWKLGQTNTSQHIATNRWTLVKIHLDTSTEAGRYEAWMRPQGGQWSKVVEWISGVTPGFRWRILPDHVGGHRVIRMPTTFGEAAESRPKYDSWIYMDDFAIARSEAGLPLY